MKQKFKAVYFADLPANSSNGKSLTLAFGKNDTGLYDKVKDLSSAELRMMIGTDDYDNLADMAGKENLPLNTYCLDRLHNALSLIRETSSQLSFLEQLPQQQLFDPLTVTFKGGSKEPFIRWYPYLEGYSPQFVKEIISKYASDSQIILDPFSGTGTTAFTASQIGRVPYFCEINPVLQFITETKIQIRRMQQKERSMLSGDLNEIYQQLEIRVNESPIDRELDNAYHLVFKDSRYFGTRDYQQILKTRALIDEVALTNTICADILTVAALSSLVPASRMKRAGDLRYKTDKERKSESIEYMKALKQKIAEIAEDIQDDVNGLQTEPILISDSAHSLAKIPHIGVDAVVTSPPYVNGTNYFRNTKIELWFLRCVLTNDDLAKFRAESVTAGINDVTVAKSVECKDVNVQKIVQRLEENAYDARIPRMVSTYFSELTRIFEGVAYHLKPNAVVAIDIGDSAYGGVHVPVDELLSSCLNDIGFVEVDNVVLRQRKSRSGMLLKQVLLVFKYQPQGSITTEGRIGNYWSRPWTNFKTQLPHRNLPFAKRNWGHSLHSLCSYMGKLKPAIAHHLISTFVPTKGKILDPFAGVGTIPFEAALQGKVSYGFDISPAALAIAKAKTQKPNISRCLKIIDKIRSYLLTNRLDAEDLMEAENFGFNGKLIEYYESKTLEEVLLARRFFKYNPPESVEHYFVLASTLHILHGNRPYALSRKSHPITPYKPSGDFEYRSLIDRLTNKVERSLAEGLPDDFIPGHIYMQDATKWWPREVDELDAIITSPPFFDSTRFYLANWLRLWFAGWRNKDFNEKPFGFIEERQKKTFDVYISVLRQARERLKSGGVVVLHLGKSQKCDMASELLKIGKQWFRSHDLFDENVSHCESHGIRDKGSVTAHSYLVLY